MNRKIVLALVLIAAFVAKDCDGKSIVSRTKRSKYYPSPPPGTRVYRRPPPQPFYPKPSGAFLYTPPPNWIDVDQRPPPRPQVSKNQGLGNEDINNIVKYLSKQDLDKIVEFANEKERDRPSPEPHRDERPDEYRESSERPFEKYPIDSMEKYRVDIQNHIGDSSQRRPTDAQPNYRTTQEDSPFNNDYSSYGEESKINYQTIPPLTKADQSKNYQSIYLNDPYAHHLNSEINDMATGKHENTESRKPAEEVLPKPINLRDDNEAQGTSKVAAIARPDSYQVENFGDLPLMEYLSKLDTVSSYHVPHYSITSSAAKYSYGSPLPAVEPAPHPSVAQQQSDAHLKAIKIWTHKSRGAAYTLNDDGSLSVERPLKPKPVYGLY